MGIGQIIFRSEDDWIGDRAVGKDLRATIDDQIIIAAIAKNCDARFDGERRGIAGCRQAVAANINTDIDAPDELICVAARETHVIGNHTADLAHILIVDVDTRVRRARRAVWVSKECKGPTGRPIVGLSVIRIERADIIGRVEECIHRRSIKRRDASFIRPRKKTGQ